MQRLPIDGTIPEIVESLRRCPSLVLEAPPGAGKTTRVPPALLNLVPGGVLVLEPRRLAARMASRRVAAEMHEPLGETVGYQVRFDEVSGPRTRLRFMTEGVLTRRLMSDGDLRGVGAVVLDEFHERHLEGDLALALLGHLRKTRHPDLRVVVMSATLAGARVAGYLGGCPHLVSEGRLFDLDVAYTPHSAAPLEEQVATAFAKLVGAGLDGDVLVFLPGAREIRLAMRTCEPIARRAGTLVLALHGDLSAEEQDRAVTPAARPKLILSTNVAESSITIEGVTAVIDSGLARVASDSPWSGLPSLQIARVSQASCRQRSGRAARTRPGRAVRLYSEEDYLRRPEHDAPDIARRELSDTLLALRAMGLGGFGDLEWLDAPPENSAAAAGELLARLGAIDARGELSATGREMARYALHPRLARLVVEARRRGAGDGGCRLAAVLSAGERLPEQTNRAGPSDLLLLMESEWQPSTKRVYQQIRQAARGGGGRVSDDDALLISVLAAFPDRVARRRQGDELLLASGGAAVLARESVVRSDEFLVAVDIEERRERGLPMVRLASAIRPEWLLDLFAGRIEERASLEWNRGAERVEGSSALYYDRLAIQESRDTRPDAEQAGRLLAAKALEAGVGRFTDAGELASFLSRASFASEHSDLPALGESEVRDALGALASGLRGFSELEDATRHGGLLRALKTRLGKDGTRLLEEIAPERLRLPGGRQVKVHYTASAPPWIESRLQDFFGVRETPRLGLGQVPVVVHLLAPNHRPVQTTTDLAGFWERLYPQVRRELMRRYPKHAWPEKP
jgi:ATP-dependent helicase HrpB